MGAVPGQRTTFGRRRAWHRLRPALRTWVVVPRAPKSSVPRLALRGRSCRFTARHRIHRLKTGMGCGIGDGVLPSRCQAWLRRQPAGSVGCCCTGTCRQPQRRQQLNAGHRRRPAGLVPLGRPERAGLHPRGATERRLSGHPVRRLQLLSVRGRSPAEGYLARLRYRADPPCRRHVILNLLVKPRRRGLVGGRCRCVGRAAWPT
jgi:hypothetical protein